MSSRKNKSSIFSIIIGFFLVILAFVSFGLSTYFGYKNYFKGANYDSSINIRYELDPYTVEDPTTHKQTYIDEKDLRDKLIKNGLKTAKEREWNNIEKDIIKMYK